MICELLRLRSHCNRVFSSCFLHPCYCVLCFTVCSCCVTFVPGAILSERSLSLDLHRKIIFLRCHGCAISILHYLMDLTLYITSITSHRIPAHITSHDMTTHDITSHHIPSSHLISSHLASNHITSPHLTTNHITPSHLATNHMTSYHITSQHITSPKTPWKHNQPPPRHHHQTELLKAGAHKELGLGSALGGGPARILFANFHPASSRNYWSGISKYLPGSLVRCLTNMLVKIAPLPQKGVMVKNKQM